MKKQCSTCPPSSAESRKSLPVNIYVVGLLNVIPAKPLHIEDPEMSFHALNEAIVPDESFDQGF